MNSKEAFQLVSNKVRYTSRLYEDELKIIQQDLDKLENLEKENQELKNTILSLELDTCIPELREENTKLKKVIKILKDKLQLVLVQDIDPLINRKIYEVEISRNYKIYSGFEVTQEQYELIEEVLKHD